MNNKFYVGRRVASFQNLGEIDKVDGIALLVDEENEYVAGDQTGYVLEVTCPYGSQAMANNLLAALQGKTYIGFQADSATISPQAELGDGITVKGIYSQLASRQVRFGPENMTDIAAPGDSELDHEYEYKSTEELQLNRKFAQTRSYIEKTAEEVRIGVESDIDDRMAEITVSLGEIELKVQGVADKASEDLANYADTVTASLGGLQNQIDGQIQTHQYNYEPTLTNKPASDWTTDIEKTKHEGDLFFWEDKGYSYRFIRTGNTWTWQMIQDTDITRALQDAAKAQDTADHKRRVFVEQPTPPYDVGDLWTQGDEGDIMRCKTARSSGNFNSGDWERASKYTDDTKAEQVSADLKVQADRITANVTAVGELGERVTSVEQTAESITTKVSGISGDVSTLQQTATDLQSSITSANGEISTLKQTATSLRSDITGLAGRVSTIEQTENDITLSVSESYSGSGGASIRLSNGSSATLDVRKAWAEWANSTSRVTVDAGSIEFNGSKVTFNNNSFISNSDNLQITEDGILTANIAILQHVSLRGHSTGVGATGPNDEGVAGRVYGRFDLENQQDTYTGKGEGYSYAIWGFGAGGGTDGTTGICMLLAYANTSMFSGNYGRAVCLGWGDNIYLKSGSCQIKADTQILVTSDRDAKKDIMPLDERYIKLFDNMSPVRFRYKIEDDTAPYTLGFIAQDVETALFEAGLERSDMSGLSGVDGTGYMALAYTDFVPILHLKIKDLEKRLKRLEEKTA